MRRRWNNGRRRAGGLVVEAALVLPLVLLFLIGTMEYGRYLMTVQLFSNAAREGAEYAAKHTTAIVLDGVVYGNAASDVTGVVTSCLGGQQLSDQSILVYKSDSVGNSLGAWTDAQAGEYICVRITGTYLFSAPALFFLPNSLAVSIQAVKRSEGN
jgi:Flp pilus assembly protein TadG